MAVPRIDGVLLIQVRGINVLRSGNTGGGSKLHDFNLTSLGGKPLFGKALLED